MAQEPNAVEQAIARALRDNLERIQRTSDELHYAVNDVVSACASSRPTNALPPLLRAQTSAASLTAALEVLSRFVALSLQTGPRSPLEAQITDLVGRTAPEPAPARQRPAPSQSEEHTSELQSPYVISYAVFCLKKHKRRTRIRQVGQLPLWICGALTAYSL